jgi:hypothetical protein
MAAVLGPNGAGKADGSSLMRATITEMPGAEKEQGARRDVDYQL